MSSTVRQIAYRLKSEGKAEVVRDAREVGGALRDSYGQAEAGANAASAAAERQERRFQALAKAAREAGQASAAQASYNAVLGVDRGPANAARESAAVFAAEAEAMEDAERRARALRAIIDPLGSAQDKLNDELREYHALAQAGKISTTELAQAQAAARSRFDETAAAIGRQEKGMSRLVVASRLNLARQGADVAVTAAMGMNPAMIAIQQGPQILDAMATSGIRLSASMLAAGASVTALVAATGVLVAAWVTGEKSATAFDRAANGMGRTAQLTAEQLQAYADAGAKVGEVSLKSAADQAQAYISTGRIGGEMIGNLISISRDYASFMGQDMEAATKSLAKAMTEPDKAAREMTRSFGLLDQKTLDHIDSLVKLGQRQEAQILLFDALNEAVSGHADRIGEIESAWDAVGRSISDAWQWLGRYLYRTDEEKLATQRNQLARLQAADERRGRGESPWTATVRGRVETAEAEIAAREKADADARAEAARNQAAQDAKDRADDARADRERAARRAEAEAERRQREAERAAREALQRTRREEDLDNSRAMEVARLRNDPVTVRALQDEAELRTRIRQLIDDGKTAEQARTQALQEQQPLLDARWQAAERESEARADQLGIDQARERGDYATAEAIEDRVREQEIYNAYLEIWHDRGMAILLTEMELATIASQRADAMERAERAAAREHQIALARASGNTGRERFLSREAWIEDRADEIARGRDGRTYDRGEADAQAAREWAELWEAEATGKRREWVKGFVADIRQSGLGDALQNQLERAADRFIDKLIDGLFDIDWSAVMNGGGVAGEGGGGITKWLSQGLDWLIGRNASGTEYWRGGLTWVGEQGPELIRAPRGTQILNHARSMQLEAAANAPGGGGVNNYYINGNLMTPEFWEMIRRGDMQAARSGASQGATAAVGIVRSTAAQTQRADRMLK